MKTNQYESVIIFSATLEDNTMEAAIKRIREFITSNGGTIDDFENWGRKRLAYPIQKSKSGYYIIFRFTALRSLIALLERTFKLDETIIRYLTVVLDKKAIKHFSNLKKEKETAQVEASGTKKVSASVDTEKVDTDKETIKANE